MADTHITPEHSVTGMTGQAPDPVVDPPAGEPSPYQTLLLAALGGFGLAMAAAVSVLLGGLVPVAAATPAAFWGSLVLIPLLAVALRGVVLGRRGGASIGASVGTGLVAWAVIVGLLGLLLHSGRSPWLLGGWFWALVVAAVLLCLLARLMIGGSEGTLAGDGLARWGLTSVLLVALIYGSYQASVTLAISAQARAAAREYVDLLVKGELVDAFACTIAPPDGRPRGNPLAAVEGLNNPTGPNEPGKYSSFCLSDHVRMMLAGAGEATITEKSLTTDYSPTGIRQAQVVYSIKNAYYDFDLAVGLAEKETRVGGSRARGWTVATDRTGAMGEVRTSDQLNAVSPTFKSAVVIARSLVEALHGRQPARGFLLTLPKEVLADENLRDLALTTPQYDRWTKGGMVDMSGAWASQESARTGAAQGLRKLFDPKEPNRSAELMVVERVNIPQFEVKGDRVTTRVDLRALIRDGEIPKYTAEGQIIVEGPASGKDIRLEDFRLVGIQWARIKLFESGPPGK